MQIFDFCCSHEDKTPFVRKETWKIFIQRQTFYCSKLSFDNVPGHQGFGVFHKYLGESTYSI